MPAEHQSAIESGFSEIARIHRLMSFHEDTSDLAKLRTANVGELMEVDADTVTVLRVAANLYQNTDGLFNIATGRQLIRTRFLPRMNTENLARFNGDSSDIEIIDDLHVRLHRRMLIDLGGIAKGYAVDCAVAALEAAGVTMGIVNAGGDLRVFGDDPMHIEIRAAQGNLSTTFAVQNCAVASSENSRTRHNIRGHIATPHIGRDNLAQVIDQTVTVMARTCIIADAMTKVAMVDTVLADRLLLPHGGQVVRFQMSEAA